MASNNKEIRRKALQDEVLQILARGPHTAYEINELLDIPRSTIYTTLKELVEDGKIRNATPHRVRNAKYTLGSYDGPNSIIPSFRYNGELYKAPFFLLTEEEVALDPYRKLFVGLARVLNAAEQLNQGRTLEEIDLILRSSKAQIMESIKDFDQLAELGRQILAEPKMWNPIYLEQFHKDLDSWRPKYHHELLKKAKEE